MLLVGIGVSLAWGSLGRVESGLTVRLNNLFLDAFLHYLSLIHISEPTRPY